MSEAIKMPNVRQQIEATYIKMIEAYDRYRLFGAELDGENYKLYYQEQLNKYRDLCTATIERIMTYNPKILEDMEL